MNEQVRMNRGRQKLEDRVEDIKENQWGNFRIKSIIIKTHWMNSVKWR